MLVAARESERATGASRSTRTPVTCSMAASGGSLTIAVQDEAGKVDLNIGSEATAARARSRGRRGGGEAAADAILDFRDSDDDRRPSGAERAEYRAAGRPQGPKNAPFFVVEELAAVLGLATGRC